MIAVSVTQAPSGPLVIALAGNPNAGKTTLFNRLTRSRAKVANYPGVTVERVMGRFRTPSGREVEAIDLPGTYSLAAQSPEEKVALDVIAGRVRGTPAPHLVVAVIDASNLERNLYLVEQLREMGVGLVVALNMIDVAEAQGLQIDVPVLASLLGVPVLAMDARSGRGVPALIEYLDRVALSPPSRETGQGGAGLAGAGVNLPNPDPRLIAERYRRIEAVCAEAVSRPTERRRSASDRLDQVLTHRVAGPLIFLASMALIFVSIFWWAAPLMDGVEAAVGALTALVTLALPPGLVRDALTDGVIAGVGNVVVFVPQIAILFFFLALIEDSGYMARAAFIMDRMMKGIGLSGRSFIPLLGSFACAIPGIMATRTIANPRDRLATILVAPFMSCSARLPIYVLVTAAFFPSPWLAGLVVFAMYLLGIAAAVGTAFLFKRVIFRTEPEVFVMELPPYRWPTLRNVWVTVKLRVVAFLRRAGTIILAITVALWFLMNFPQRPDIEADFAARRDALVAENSSLPFRERGSGGERAMPEELEARLLRLAVQERSALLQASYAGQLGRLLEPVVKPLGFDWKIGIGLIGSFAAREVLVSTLGVVYSLDEEIAGDQPATVAEAMRADRWPDGSPIFTPLVGFSIMVFFVLAMMCMSTLAVVRRETNSWRWPLFMFTYMTGLAYLAALAVYQGGRLLGF